MCRRKKFCWLEAAIKRDIFLACFVFLYKSTLKHEPGSFLTNKKSQSNRNLDLCRTPPCNLTAWSLFLTYTWLRVKLSFIHHFLIPVSKKIKFSIPHTVSFMRWLLLLVVHNYHGMLTQKKILVYFQDSYQKTQFENRLRWFWCSISLDNLH